MWSRTYTGPAAARREKFSGLAPPEASRTDIRITEGEHRHAPRAAGLEQFHAAESQLLGVVHDDRPQSLQRGEPRRAGRKRADEAQRLTDEARGVAMGSAHAVARIQVLPREGCRRRPLRDAVPRGKIRQVIGGDSELRALGEQSAQLAAERARGAHGRRQRERPPHDPVDLILGVSGQQIGDHLVLVRTGQQLGHRLATMDGLGADDLVAERHDRARQRAGCGDADGEGEAVSRRSRGGARWRQHEHLVRLQDAVRFVRRRPNERADRAIAVAVLPDPGRPPRRRTRRRKVDDGTLSGIPRHDPCLSR
jgi:hypothetical protein